MLSTKMCSILCPMSRPRLPLFSDADLRWSTWTISCIVSARDIPAIIYSGVREALASNPLPLRYGLGMGELCICPRASFWRAKYPFYTLGGYGEYRTRPPAVKEQTVKKRKLRFSRK